jgi:hypothetical protein
LVEKSTLIWSESTGKRLALKALVRIGSVLFVRLIQPLGAEAVFRFRTGRSILEREIAGRTGW